MTLSLVCVVQWLSKGLVELLMKNTSSVKDEVPVKEDLEHFTVAILSLLR